MSFIETAKSVGGWSVWRW